VSEGENQIKVKIEKELPEILEKEVKEKVKEYIGKEIIFEKEEKESK